MMGRKSSPWKKYKGQKFMMGRKSSPWKKYKGAKGEVSKNTAHSDQHVNFANSKDSKIGRSGGSERGGGRFERHQRRRGGFERSRGGFLKRKRRKGENNVIKQHSENYVQELKLVLEEVPLFRLNEALNDGLDEYNGLSLNDLFEFLSLISKLSRRKRNVLWSRASELWRKDAKNPNVDAMCKELLESLPPPTLKKSLSYSRRMILDDFPKMFQIVHPDTPNCQKSGQWIRHALKQEVENVCGICPVPPNMLLKKLGPAGQSILLKNFLEFEDVYFSRVAEMLKKSPDHFGNEVVYDKVDVIID